MRIEQRRWHQRVGFQAGVAEHDALVAGTFVLVTGAIDALRDVGGLRVQMHGHIGMLPMKTFLLIADVADGHTGQMRQQFGRDRAGAAGFTGQDDAVGGDQRFTGDARIGVGGQERVQHRVADPVRDLVGVAFGNRFRGKQIFARVPHG